MTDKSIDKIINDLNAKKQINVEFKEHISSNVEFTKVRFDVKTFDGSQPATDQSIFYFIKNDEGFYVGAVYDMKHNLHFYILKEYRNKGHLVKALKGSIVDHLFKSRDEIRITIDEDGDCFEAAEKVALSSGFNHVRGDLYIQKRK